MYYYAFVDENDIVQSIYSLPTTIDHSQYIQIASNDQTLIGKHYNRSTLEFEDVYYYAVLNEKGIVVNVTYSYEAISDSNYIAITATQYSDGSIVGMYWNGTNFVTAPISLLAVASTDTVNYKNQDKWLSTKLDEMDEAITGKAAAVHGHTVSDVTGLSDELDAISENFATLETSVAGKAAAAHTHTASDISGVVKTINGTAPDESGNIAISVTGDSMTANEILTAIKTVDGANSGLDADTLDGMEATSFAAANHTHTEYLTEDDVDNFVTSAALTEALGGKADTTHNHDTVYAPIAHNHANYAAADHTHTGYATTASVTALETAVSGKADSTHNHDTAYAAINHTHTGYASADHTHTGYAAVDHTHTGYAATDHTHDGYAATNHTHSEYATSSSVSALENTVNGKADVNHTHTGYASSDHTHSEYAPASHTHSQSDIAGLSTALAGKASTSHTHSEYASANHTHSGYASSSHTHSNYLSTSGGTISGDVNVTGLVRVGGQQCMYNSGSMVTLSTNNRETMIAGSAIYSKVQISVSSDERLKENIKAAPTSDLVKFVENLDIKTFNYIGNEEEENIGVIAQELIKENTDLAKYFVRQDENGYYSVKTADLVFPLIVAVQELAKEIEQLKK